MSKGIVSGQELTQTLLKKCGYTRKQIIEKNNESLFVDWLKTISYSNTYPKKIADGRSGHISK